MKVLRKFLNVSVKYMKSVVDECNLIKIIIKSAKY